MNLERDKKYWINSKRFPEDFMVCSDGRILSLRTGRELKQYTNNGGYKVIGTKIGGRKGKNVLLRVHVEVAVLFVPNPHNYPHVNHIDGIKAHNDWWNLEWCTQKMNMQHAVSTGLHKGAGTRRFTVEELNEFIVNPSKLSLRELSTAYKVHHSVISRLRQKARLKSRIK